MGTVLWGLPSWADILNMKLVPTVLVLWCLCSLLLCVEGGRNGRRGGRKVGGARRKVWHVAEEEEQCGKYTKLMEEEKPTDLCKEENVQICICATKDDVSSGNAIWSFRCGSCEIKWRPVKDEAQKEKRKALAKEKRKRKLERMKMRQKLKKKSKAKAEKARKRKNRKKNKNEE